MKYKELIKKIKNYFNNTRYIKYYNEKTIIPKTVLLEASHGNSVYGNIYYILKELVENDKYSDFKIYLSASKKKKQYIENAVRDFDKSRFEVVIVKSKKYYEVISSSEYLINDTSFLPFFVKKDGQKYLNVWHGTPLKTLGKKVEGEQHLIGNVQKNFLVADYLMYPNEYTKEHMVEDYMISNISKAEIIMNGYPRNTVFFDKEKKDCIIEKYNLKGKKVYVYMPTWRGATGNISSKENNDTIRSYLSTIDEMLNSDEMFYVKLHPFVNREIDLECYNHIFKMPDDCETYEFLNAADCLVTDYSSVMYDFAVTREKIILFVYDKEKYIKNRGLYESIDSLPFNKVNNPIELVEMLRKEKSYNDTEFLEKYCLYDSYDATRKLCEYVFWGNDIGLKREKLNGNEKPNVLIYGGNLAKNGITTALLNLLNEMDKNKRNYYLTFRDSKIEENKDMLLNLPVGINYIATTGRMNMNIRQKIVSILYTFRKIKFEKYWKTVKSAFINENQRIYGDIVFDEVIQYSGYDFKWMLRFVLFACRRVIYLHSDMIKEMEVRNNQRREVLDYVYNEYDNIAVVTDALIESTEKIVTDKRKIKVVKNIIDYKDVLSKSSSDLAFDEDTQCNFSIKEIKEIFYGTAEIFINVGRFSPEKGHKRLINAFEKIYNENDNVYLFIVGGVNRNNEYENLEKYIGQLNCRDNVVLILSMSNPFPLVKLCDYFVFSSFYEGFGLVLAEANILGLPVISTDISGPRTFMKENGGLLVENSETGLYEGMKMLLNGEVPVMNVDYDDYNKKAIEEFEGLFD